MSAIAKMNGKSAFGLRVNGMRDSREVNGMYTPSPISQQSIVCSYDPAHPDCYPGTGTAMYDLTGNGNTITLGGGVESGYDSTGWFNLDGVNDTGASSATTVSGDCSVGGWYRITGDDDFLQMFAGTLNGSLDGIQVYYNCVGANNRFFARVQDDAAIATAVSVPEVSLTISTGTWYYVCASWNNVTHELNHYVFDSSGVGGSNSTVSTGIDTTATDTADIIFGAATYYSYGDVGEVHLYSEALTETQFTAIYNRTKAKYGY